MLFKLIVPLVFFGLLSGCYGYGSYRHHHDTPRARYDVLGSGDAATHAHMDSEREHLRQEEAEHARRHRFGY